MLSTKNKHHYIKTYISSTLTPPTRLPACLPARPSAPASSARGWSSINRRIEAARAQQLEPARTSLKWNAGRTCGEQRARNHRDFLNNTPERNYDVWYLSENLTLNSFWPSDWTECVSTALCCVMSGESFRTHTTRCQSLNPALFEVVELNVGVHERTISSVLILLYKTMAVWASMMNIIEFSV